MTNKGIDLGTLQREYEAARKAHMTDQKALEKSQTQADQSKKIMRDCYDALKNASRTVLE